MFDFEEWSKRLYQKIEEDSDRGGESSVKEAELNDLWEELFQQKDNTYVQFLDQLLMLTKENLHNEKERDVEKLEKLVENMRESVLDKQID